jgi:phosphonate transport system permease protein
MTGAATLLARRAVVTSLVLAALGWALVRALGGTGTLLNPGGLKQLRELVSAAGSPSVDPVFLALVRDATATTLAFALAGTAGALLVGAVGGLVLADAPWRRRPPLPVRVARDGTRLLLVAARSVHEVVWALLLAAVIGLDPSVAVIAIAVPFGAQTAKVFAEILDGTDRRPALALADAGARPLPALVYGPVLLGYSFYRFECALRSAVVLGVVGAGGLGQELVVSLQSLNWDEVATLVLALMMTSAAAEGASSLVRSRLGVVTCTEWSGGSRREAPDGPSVLPRWALVTAVVLAGWAAWAVRADWAKVLSGPTLDRAVLLAHRLWPPAGPRGGWGVLAGAVADTLAMALLAMVLAVVGTILLGPVAARPFAAGGWSQRPAGPARVAVRWAACWVARLMLLFLRTVPPSVWAVVALFVMFPGILPGAAALGLYTAGVLGRLIAEMLESLDREPARALSALGATAAAAAVVGLLPAALHRGTAYLLYRLEICVRDTAVVGVVGAAGLGRLLDQELASFRYPVVTSVLAASLAISLGTELLSRAARRSLDP